MRSDRRSPSALAAVLVVVAPALLAGAAPDRMVVERTLAFVNKKPVLLSDVAITKALLQLGDAEALERTIDESLMLEEASRLLNEALPDEAIANAVLTLGEKAGPGFSSTSLRRKALAQLAISNYIDLRLRPLVRVEDAEIRKVFNERVVNDPQAPVFSLIESSIRQALERRSLDRRVEEWVASLRSRADIRRPLTRP